MALEDTFKRFTIDFPVKIPSEELEEGLFEYIRESIDCEMTYHLVTSVEKRHNPAQDERYIVKVEGNMRRPLGRNLARAGFEVEGSSHENLYFTLFKRIKFNVVPGYETLEEIQSLPTGEEQIELVDEVRKATEEYFSARER